MIQRRIKCDQCNGTFFQSVEKRSAPPPDECPLCHNTGTQTEAALVWISKEKREADRRIRQMVDEGKAPGYNADARLQLKSEEMTFRAMEAGANIRAEAAASELNLPVSEMSNLKITDMKDNPKTGENSAKIPLTQQALVMREQARQMSFGQGSTASAFAGQGTIINGKAVGTTVGPDAVARDPNDGKVVTRGSAFRGILGKEHANIARSIESRPMGRY